MQNAYPPLTSLLIAQGPNGIPTDLTACLARQSYSIQLVSSGLDTMMQTIQAIRPQLVILPQTQDSSPLLDMIQHILGVRTTGIVVLLETWDAPLARRILDAGVSGYLIRPFETVQTRAILESSWHHFYKLNLLQENLELRKLMQQAKGILMRDRFITEEDAHQTILRMSQDQGISLRELCRSLIQVKAPLKKDATQK